jgi:hypothetical protein
MPSSGVTVSITPVCYYVIPLRVSPIVIIVMYYLVPTPESFETIVIKLFDHFPINRIFPKKCLKDQV